RGGEGSGVQRERARSSAHVRSFLHGRPPLSPSLVVGRGRHRTDTLVDAVAYPGAVAVAEYDPGRSVSETWPFVAVLTCRPPSVIATPATGSPASRAEIVTFVFVVRALSVSCASRCVWKKPPESANRSTGPAEPSHCR